MSAASTPNDWGLVKKNYNVDAEKILRHMKYCVEQTTPEESPGMDLINQNCKKELTEFNSIYLSGKAGGVGSNNLRTDISLLITHYAQSGFKRALKPELKERLLRSIAKTSSLLSSTP